MFRSGDGDVEAREDTFLASYAADFDDMWTVAGPALIVQKLVGWVRRCSQKRC